VLALALKSGVLYIGGQFQQFGGETRSHLAAVHVATGEVLPWNPAPDQPVFALLPSDSTVYVGGRFSIIAGATRWSVAEVGMSGLATAWNPKAGFSGGAGTVRAITAIGDTIYIGGSFGSVGGQFRYNAGAVHAVTGLATEWDPHASGYPDNQYEASPYVGSLVPGDGTMYVAGHFAWIKGRPRGALAEVDRVSGEPTEWNPTPYLGPGWDDFAPYVTAILVTESTVYASGNFSYMGSLERPFLAEVHRSTGAPTAWNPRPNTIVDVLAMSGDLIYAGGRFASVGEWQTRRNLAAFDATTGELKDWNPDPDGLIVYDVAVHGDRVYVGGHFWTIGGAARGAIAALDPITGEALAWTADMNEVPTVLKVMGDRLYAGGRFTTVGGVPRSRLASFDLDTGQLTDWNPLFDDDVSDIVVRDSTIYVGGFFRSVGGVTRRGLAAVNARSGQPLDWNPSPDVDAVYQLAILNNTLFAGGAFRHVGGLPRSRLAAIDATTGEVKDWIADAAHANPNFVRVFTLEVAGDNLYVGGSFHSIAGVPRSGLAALDAESAAVLPWNPAPGDPSTDYPLQPAVIWALTADDDRLLVGGRFRYVGTTPANTLASISIDVPKPPEPPLPPPSVIALAPMSPNPVRAAATVRFALPSQGPVSLSVYDLQGRQVATILRQQHFPAGRHEIPLTAAAWKEGFYFLRLEAGGAEATRKFVVIR
jgi:hypothetical protein